ncbi:MAG TPA: helix-turn-helix transcriptional regulator [Candidatus Elarobacter sp.]|nr:helix-turn-helix transcriptional regulator [Candidatus Elarobacter sp.]
MPDSIGERVRALRTRLRLTPNDLAHAAGVSEPAIRQIESGQTKSPSFAVGLKLAHALAVTPWFLLNGRDGPEKGSHSPELRPIVAERLAAEISGLERRVRSLEAWRRAGKRRKSPE